MMLGGSIAQLEQRALRAHRATMISPIVAETVQLFFPLLQMCYC